jgi:hypothetical protein
MEFMLGVAVGWFVTKYWNEIKPALMDVAARIPWIKNKLK